MKKIVLNTNFGGFNVSQKIVEELGLGDKKYGFLSNGDFDIVSDNYDEYRSDERLISAIEKFGLVESAGGCAVLSLVELPDDVVEKGWYISEYDGVETVHEEHWRRN